MNSKYFDDQFYFLVYSKVDPDFRFFVQALNSKTATFEDVRNKYPKYFHFLDFLKRNFILKECI